jgi:hypothetical protein
VNRADVFANPEVEKAVAKMRNTLRQIVSGESFAERETSALAIGNEVVRGLPITRCAALWRSIVQAPGWSAFTTGRS